MKALKNSLMAIVALFAIVITVAAQAGTLDNTSLKIDGPGCYDVAQPPAQCSTTYPTIPSGLNERVLTQKVCVNEILNVDPIDPAEDCIGTQNICCYDIVAVPQTECCTGFKVRAVFFEN